MREVDVVQFGWTVRLYAVKLADGLTLCDRRSSFVFGREAEGERAGHPYSMPVDEASRYETVRKAVAETIDAVTGNLVASGAAKVVTEAGHGVWTASVSPANAGAAPVTICVQSEFEVSLWPAAPSTDRAPTVDIFDKDTTRLLLNLRAYLEAILAGRLELTLRRGRSSGRCRVHLANGNTEVHFYNTLGFLVGRGSSWEHFAPEPY